MVIVSALCVSCPAAAAVALAGDDDAERQGVEDRMSVHRIAGHRER